MISKRVRSLVRNLIKRGRVEQEIDDELRAFGQLTPAEMEVVKEEVRDIKAGSMVYELMQDLRYGWRILRLNPAFAAVAVVALALGIGANTAMFSVAYGILLRPLPYPGADRVAVVYMRYFPRDFAFGTLCIRDFLTWRDNNHAFEEPSLFRSLRVDVGGNEGVPEQVQGASVTARFFPTLGARTLIGRIFAAGEDQPGAPSRTVLAESIWRRRFSADPGVLGRTILVNGTPSTVIGVVPSEFRFPRRDTALWTNLPLNPPTRYGPWLFRAVARLKPGITPEQAQSDLARTARILMEQNRTYQRLSFPVLSLRDSLLGTAIKPAILVLGGAVGLVLLIAVVNVANLMLARATVREREMALRLSLGAAWGRLVRQLLAESALLASLGGVAGLALAWAAIAWIRAWNPGNLPLVDSVRLDWTALGFTLCASLLTGVLFGLAPALQSTRADLNSILKEGGRGSSSAGRARRRARAGLVIAEVSLSLMLLVGAGLLLRSFANLQSVTAGMASSPRRVLTIQISPGDRKYNDASMGLPLYDEILRRARSLPGVELAALSDSLPPDRQWDADTFGIEGQDLPQGEINPIVTDVTVTPDLFAALGIPLLKGRPFDAHDSPKSEPVAIVSEGFARRFLPGDPIGRRIRASGPGGGNPWMRIVGVVGNVKYLGLTTDTDAAYYLPFAQSYGARMSLVVRTSADAARVAPALRDAVQPVDPGMTLAQVSTMYDALTTSMSQPRFDTVLLTVFAAIALMLASIGIYGLIAYSVAQRTHEIGVRMALGAARGDVVRMVVHQGAILALAGIAAGIAGAFALTRLLGTMLFGIGATDPLTFAAAPAALLIVVLLATIVPALRATRVSPVVALRYE